MLGFGQSALGPGVTLHSVNPEISKPFASLTVQADTDLSNLAYLTSGDESGPPTVYRLYGEHNPPPVPDISWHTGNALLHKQSSECVQGAGEANAEGMYCEATGWQSHAEGHNAKASGHRSHAEGQNTQATNWYAHAENEGSLASGEGSHAQGCYTVASGNYAHAAGQETVAQGYAQTAIGVFNAAQGTTTSKTATDFSFIIGNGTSNSIRSNALTVDWGGNLVTAGAVFMDNVSGTPKPVATQEYVNNNKFNGGNITAPINIEAASNIYETAVVNASADSMMGGHVTGELGVDGNADPVDSVYLLAQHVENDTVVAYSKLAVVVGEPPYVEYGFGQKYLATQEYVDAAIGAAMEASY